MCCRCVGRSRFDRCLPIAEYPTRRQYASMNRTQESRDAFRARQTIPGRSTASLHQGRYNDGLRVKNDASRAARPFRTHMERHNKRRARAAWIPPGCSTARCLILCSSRREGGRPRRPTAVFLGGRERFSTSTSALARSLEARWEGLHCGDHCRCHLPGHRRALGLSIRSTHGSCGARRPSVLHISRPG